MLVYPATGKILNCKANTRINTAASQKFGTAIPRLHIHCTIRSARPPRTAASMPRTSPRTRVNSVATRASDSVGGKAADNFSVTGRPSRKDLPKSPRTAPATQLTKRSSMGRSRPSWVSNVVICC